MTHIERRADRSHSQWSTGEEAPKRKASGYDSPAFAESNPRTPPAPLWTGGQSSFSSAPSPVAGPSSALSLNFDGMNLESPAAPQQQQQQRGAEGDIEEMVLAAPPCRGMKMKARVRTEDAILYSTRPSRRRKVQSPLAIEIVPPPPPPSAPTEPSFPSASPPASTASEFPLPSIFDEFPLFGQLSDSDGFGQPYEESAADTLKATGTVLDSPETPYLQMAELAAAGFC